jgi:hypothetical protein
MLSINDTKLSNVVLSLVLIFMASVKILSVFMLIVIILHVSLMCFFTLSVFMLSDFMLSVFMLHVILMSFFTLSVFMLSAFVLSVACWVSLCLWFNADRLYAECLHVECLCADCLYPDCCIFIPPLFWFEYHFEI